MKRKIVCYFENEVQCETAVTALIKTGIESDAIRIVSGNAQKGEANKTPAHTLIGSAAPFALPDNISAPPQNEETNYAQAPIATLLIRGDLFTFDGNADEPRSTCAVEVCANEETIESAREILLNLF